MNLINKLQGVKKLLLLNEEVYAQKEGGLQILISGKENQFFSLGKSEMLLKLDKNTAIFYHDDNYGGELFGFNAIKKKTFNLLKTRVASNGIRIVEGIIFGQYENSNLKRQLILAKNLTTIEIHPQVKLNFRTQGASGNLKYLFHIDYGLNMEYPSRVLQAFEPTSPHPVWEKDLYLITPETQAYFDEEDNHKLSIIVEYQLRNKIHVRFGGIGWLVLNVDTGETIWFKLLKYGISSILPYKDKLYAIIYRGLNQPHTLEELNQNTLESIQARPFERLEKHKIHSIDEDYIIIEHLTSRRKPKHILFYNRHNLSLEHHIIVNTRFIHEVIWHHRYLYILNGVHKELFVYTV